MTAQICYIRENDTSHRVQAPEKEGFQLGDDVHSLRNVSLTSEWAGSQNCLFGLLKRFCKYSIHVLYWKLFDGCLTTKMVSIDAIGKIIDILVVGGLIRRQRLVLGNFLKGQNRESVLYIVPRKATKPRKSVIEWDIGLNIEATCYMREENRRYTGDEEFAEPELCLENGMNIINFCSWVCSTPHGTSSIRNGNNMSVRKVVLLVDQHINLNNICDGSTQNKTVCTYSFFVFQWMLPSFRFAELVLYEFNKINPTAGTIVLIDQLVPQIRSSCSSSYFKVR